MSEFPEDEEEEEKEEEESGADVSLRDGWMGSLEVGICQGGGS